MTTTFDKVKKVTADLLGGDTINITEHTSLIDDLRADSLDVVEIVMALEDEFDIEISDEYWDGIITVGDAAKLVDRLAE